MTSKLYGVKNGRDGPFCMYDHWTPTNLAARAMKGCKYKSFPTKEECLKWLDDPNAKIIRMADLPPAEVHTVSQVYTDGGCLDNGTPHARAGVGVYYGNKRPRLSIPLPGQVQTNNRAELMGLLLGVLGAPRDTECTINTDSKYSIRAVTELYPNETKRQQQGWEEPANWDLIHVIAVALEDRPLVRLKHVYGHQGHQGNEEAHQLATKGIQLNVIL